MKKRKTVVHYRVLRTFDPESFGWEEFDTLKEATKSWRRTEAEEEQDIVKVTFEYCTPKRKIE